MSLRNRLVAWPWKPTGQTKAYDRFVCSTIKNNVCGMCITMFQLAVKVIRDVFAYHVSVVHASERSTLNKHVKNALSLYDWCGV